MIQVGPGGSSQTLGCYDTLAEAQAAVEQLTSSGQSAGIRSQSVSAAASFTLAWHFSDANGLGSSVAIVGTTCSSTWIPSSWWATHMSSTEIGPSCSAAKHYTLSSCGGSYQVINAPYPAITNLNSALNDNSHCVKYG